MIDFGGASDKIYIESNVGDVDTMVVTLQKWGNETIKKFRESLRKKISTDTSKNLEQKTIVLPVQFGANKYVMFFSAPDYWKFINKGVSGKGGKRQSDGQIFVNKAPGSPFKFKEKKPPILRGEGLSQWAHQKHINPFALRESIFRRGIKATNYFDEVWTKEWIGVLVKRLEKSGAKEVELILSQPFK